MQQAEPTPRAELEYRMPQLYGKIVQLPAQPFEEFEQLPNLQQLPEEVKVEATQVLPANETQPPGVAGLLPGPDALPAEPPVPRVLPLVSLTATQATPLGDLLTEAGWPLALHDEARAVITCESGGNANAVSSEGARGLFQIMPDPWARWAQVTPESLFDPLVNAHVAWLMYHEYDGDSWRQWQCKP